MPTVQQQERSEDAEYEPQPGARGHHPDQRGVGGEDHERHMDLLRVDEREGQQVDQHHRDDDEQDVRLALTLLRRQDARAARTGCGVGRSINWACGGGTRPSR